MFGIFRRGNTHAATGNQVENRGADAEPKAPQANRPSGGVARFQPKAGPMEAAAIISVRKASTGVGPQFQARSRKGCEPQNIVETGLLACGVHTDNANLSICTGSGIAGGRVPAAQDRNRLPAFKPTVYSVQEARKLAGKKVLWNPSYPHIYIRPPRSDSQGKFLRRIADTLNRIAESSEGHALLMSISAAGEDDHRVRIIIGSIRKSPHLAYFRADKSVALKYKGIETEEGNRVVPVNKGRSGGKIFFKIDKKGSDISSEMQPSWLRQILFHELTHASHDANGNKYREYSGLKVGKSGGAEEESRTRVTGRYIGLAIGELRSTILSGDRLFLSYLGDFGYDVPSPWERNAGDEAIFPLREGEILSTPIQFPRTSLADQQAKEQAADVRFLAAQVEHFLQSLTGGGAGKAAFSTVSQFDPAAVPTLKHKQRAQEAMYFEAIRLAQAGRFAAAYYLIKMFPQDMLSHLRGVEQSRLELTAVKKLIGTRYAEEVEGRLAGLRLNQQLYHYHQQLSDFYLNIKGRPQLRNDREETNSPIEHVRAVQRAHAEIWETSMKAVAPNTPARRNLEFEKSVFDTGAPRLEELFFYMTDRSEHITDYMQVLARTPSDVFRKSAWPTAERQAMTFDRMYRADRKGCRAARDAGHRILECSKKSGAAMV